MLHIFSRAFVLNPSGEAMASNGCEAEYATNEVLPRLQLWYVTVMIILLVIMLSTVINYDNVKSDIPVILYYCLTVDISNNFRFRCSIVLYHLRSMLGALCCIHESSSQPDQQTVS